jgi:hypothetical protein
MRSHTVMPCDAAGHCKNPHGGHHACCAKSWWARLRFAHPTTPTYIGRTSTTSGTKCFSRFWMPCCSVAVEDGQPEQAPFMLR